jgi:hypothetical protein
MNDKDFDKIFGDKLREERSFNSQDSDWEQLSKRLNGVSPTPEKDNRRRGAAWLWLLALPIVSLLLWQMKEIKDQNKQLAAQLIEVQSQLAAHNSQRDTIVRNIQKTDTVIIYKYLPVSKKEEKKNNATHSTRNNTSDNINVPPSPSNRDASPVSNDFSAKNTPNFDNARVLSMSKTVPQPDTVIPKAQVEERKMTELTEKLAALDKQIADLKQAITESTANAARLADCAANQNLLKKQLGEAMALADSLKKQPLSKETPKIDKILKNNRLFIGVQGGRINYKTTWKNSAGVEIYKNFNSYQGGLKLEYALTDKVRLTAGGDFCPFSFLIYWQDARYNLPTTQFDPLKEKYLKAESQQTLLQGNVGAKYMLTEGTSKWRPYVSAAYSMMRIKPFQTKFTYQPLWGTTNREQIVESKAINISNLLLLSGGLEYRFSKYGVAQAEAFYYKDVNKTHQTFDLFGARAAILLNIK